MEQLQVGYKLFLPTQDGFQRLDIQCFQNLQMLLTSCSSQDSEIQVRIAGTAQHPQPNDRLLLTGIHPHFSALSGDDPGHVSSLSHQLGSAGVLAHVVLLCPRGVVEFYPHTGFRSAGIRKDKRHCCLRG